MKMFTHPQMAIAAAMFCAMSAQAQPMSNQDYSAAQDRIKADYKTARAQCDKLDGNAKDICVEEAKGAEKIADAQLKYQRSGKAGDAEKLAVVKADAAFEVAKERCDDLKGNEKDACVKDAKATHARAKADAKAHKG